MLTVRRTWLYLEQTLIRSTYDYLAYTIISLRMILSISNPHFHDIANTTEKEMKEFINQGHTLPSFKNVP